MYTVECETQRPESSGERAIGIARLYGIAAPSPLPASLPLAPRCTVARLGLSSTEAIKREVTGIVCSAPRPRAREM